uniref:Right handed beta helix domain-containing protein n=1 Tax=Amphimedon queenslandica TaxID=400682 RepID=A0A1X7T265_AMPQE
MSLLLVVVLLFFSSSCSVSSGQYYVSDYCSSVTQSPCNPLSVYAGDMSQYNNTIFYFIGTTTINDNVTMTAVKNVTLHGLDQSPSINCKKFINNTAVYIYYSDHVTISNISFSSCTVEIDSSNNVTITNSVFASDPDLFYYLVTSNAFDLKISSSVFSNFVEDYTLYIYYLPLPVCSDELLHYSLMLTNVTFTTGSGMELYMTHGTTYNVSIIFDQVEVEYCKSLLFQVEGLFYLLIINSSFHNNVYALFIQFSGISESSHCTYPGIQVSSTFVIESCQFYHNPFGLNILSVYFIALDYHIIIKSCLMYDNIFQGLSIDGTFLRLTQIDIIDTELIGNRVGNKIMNSNAISLSNVTVANSTYTGLTLEKSSVTVKNTLIFKNNVGVVGGGLAINDSSRLIVSSSANLEFIDNHASYKGGGIYSEESSHYNFILLKAPNVSLTLINNTAGLVGGDLYGVYVHDAKNDQFHLTNPNISSTSDAVEICFCDPHTTTSYENCLHH